ncbi:MAG: tRNA 2-thiouridine(34) synthase MnmA [Deltaproteobacteria bacterium]|jgi:tRNA-specific 2-thiouridylase|nr:tRNA 2-thiouridine(34) synthase MnmA [Deltaproteobacteria bacterium]
MKPTTAVAVSGGVDSMMAACLLKEQGHHVIGVHFVSGYEADAVFTPARAESESHPINAIGEQLGISIKLLDCRIAFKQQVVDYFIQTYFDGRTPNPCMVCNPLIKFGAVLSYAHELGADRLATGHYARIQKDAAGIYHLLKGIDPLKDQSYFLARLNQSQMAKAIFPMGDRLKSDIKEEARQRGLRPVTKSESQDVCFIRDKSYNEFLQKHGDPTPSPGPIVDLQGNVIGHHNGLHQFTIGQRRGINCPAPEPYYVVRIDPAGNRLVVGSKSDLLATSCKVTDINWINQAPCEPITVLTRVRYRHREAAGKLYPVDEQTAEIRFESPIESITPGQGAVFYQGNEVLGGGFISPDT